MHQAKDQVIIETANIYLGSETVVGRYSGASGVLY